MNVIVSWFFFCNGFYRKTGNQFPVKKIEWIFAFQTEIRLLLRKVTHYGQIGRSMDKLPKVSINQ